MWNDKCEKDEESSQATQDLPAAVDVVIAGVEKSKVREGTTLVDTCWEAVPLWVEDLEVAPDLDVATDSPTGKDADASDRPLFWETWRHKKSVKCIRVAFFHFVI